MADVYEMVLAAVRKHIASRRQDISEKFPKNLPRREYWKHVGRHEELESLAGAVQDAVRKANAADAPGDPDEPDQA